MAISGLGSFAGGMARGIESGVGLVNQYEDISRRRRRRDAAGALQELGTFEDFSEQNTQAIPVQFQGAEADLTPGAQPLAPTGGALPDVMTAGGMKRPHFNEYVAAREKAFAPFYEDNPELMFQVRKDLEETRRHMLMEAAYSASLGSDEEASQILGEAYDRLLGDNDSEPAEIQVVTTPSVDGKPGQRLVRIGEHTMPFDQLGALLRNPEKYDEWLQSAQQFDVTARQTERGLDIQEDRLANEVRGREDTARFRSEELAIMRANAETQRDYYAQRLAAVGAERGEAYAERVQDGFKLVSQAETNYLADLRERDSEFAERFGHTIGVVADALVEADPTKSGRHYLNTAEWMVRTRDPQAFKRMLEQDPGTADRWSVQLPDGTRVPAFEVRPDGGADIKVFTAPIVDDEGNVTGQYDFIIDPITGARQRLTPQLRSVFDRLEEGLAAPAPAPAATPPAPPATPESGIPDPAAPARAAPDSTAGAVGGAIREGLETGAPLLVANAGQDLGFAINQIAGALANANNAAGQAIADLAMGILGITEQDLPAFLRRKQRDLTATPEEQEFFDAAMQHLGG